MMRSAILLSTALLAGAANADVLGLTAEAGLYSPSAKNGYIGDHNAATTSSNLDGKSGGYFGIALEHPIPLIPNIRIQHQNLKAEGTAGSQSEKLDLSHNDYTLYYQFLDGLIWINLDGGVTFRKFDGSVTLNGTKTNLSKTYPLGYLSAFLTVPGTKLSFGTDIKVGGVNSSRITDTTFKVKYETPFRVGIEAGYKKASLKLNDIGGKDLKSDFSGAFIGAFVHF